MAISQLEGDMVVVKVKVYSFEVLKYKLLKSLPMTMEQIKSGNCDLLHPLLALSRSFGPTIFASSTTMEFILCRGL